MSTAILESEVRGLVQVFSGDRHDEYWTNALSNYALQILNRPTPNYTNVLELEDALLSNPSIPIHTSFRLRRLLKSFKSHKSVKHFSNYIVFLLLLKRDQVSCTENPTSFFSALSSLPKEALPRRVDNNMSTGYTSRGNPSNSNQSTGFNGEAPLGRGFVSGSQTPISLWGAPSTSSTFDRGTGSRRAVRGQSSTNVGSTTSPAEQELLREAILSLSGASGTLIHYNPTLDAFVPASNLVISPSIQSHILRISVCGWLYNRVRRFIDGVRDDPAAGKVMLSLALSVDEQLTEYLRLITQLEAQLNFDNDPSNYQDTSAFGSTANTTAAAVAPPSGQFTTSASAAQSTYSLADTGQGSLGSSRQPLTLLRLSHWLMEPKRRLKILAALADNCASLKGGALVSKVYEMAQNGGPQLRAMLTNILVDVTRTIYEMIALWIYDGRLSSDPNQEFFITTNPSANKDNLWSDKYGLRKSMVPVFISKDQARKILLIGKSVNFLMHVCGDPQHFKDLEAIRKTRITQLEALFNQDFDPSFDHMVSTAYQHISKRLLETLLNRYHFMDHLRATRKFLLLGQGDFIQRLMDLLEPELGMPAQAIMRHRLNEILETAIRDTNAQYEDPEILQRLNVEILETADGDSGWDVFSLGYVVNGPLLTIFTPDCRLFYLKAFSFLWRLKRMEFTLSTLWREQLVLARLPCGLSEDLTPILHVVQLLCAEFRHFVLQLQYYVNFEALECAWEALVQKINDATDLDEVINAHKGFLSNVISRCLLDRSSGQLRYQLRAIFDVIVNFSQLNMDLQDLAKEELELRSQLQREVEGSARTGTWGTCDTPENQEVARRKVFVETTIGPMIARIRVLASSYRDMATEFMTILQNHTDQSLRLLVQNLNFNSHYLDTTKEA